MNSSPTAAATRVRCEDCRWLRMAPWQAKKTGCYHPEHMPGKQKDPVLDEQQVPGDHAALNRRGDCARYEAKPPRASLWQRLWA
ncbi:MAG: hypothetical protein FJ299_04440 [Planctomycetes bacterium]|nr:hypothetical protein [Planctomycetota bacterium]